MHLIFEQVRMGGDRNFGYLLADRAAKHGVLVDPSYAPGLLVERAREQGIQITHVVNTHSHPDHVNGNAAAVEQTGASIAAFASSPIRPDLALADDQELAIGALRLTFLHTPGHCADHLVVYEHSYRLLITGDLLFVGKVGGTPSDDDARTEWSSLQRVIDRIPDDATMWPGHDYGVRPSSTIGLERKTNPFLLCADVDAFLGLKRGWASFKKEHGLK